MEDNGLFMAYAKYAIKQGASTIGPKIKSALMTNPDLSSILLLLLILYVSLKILTYSTRMIYNFVFGFVKLLVFIVIITGVFWMAVRGVNGMYSDIILQMSDFDYSSITNSITGYAYNSIYQQFTRFIYDNMA